MDESSGRRAIATVLNVDSMTSLCKLYAILRRSFSSHQALHVCVYNETTGLHDGYVMPLVVLAYITTLCTLTICQILEEE